MDWSSVQVPAAIVAGIVSLVIGTITAIVTIQVAKQNIAAERAKIVLEQQQANRRPFLQKQLEICFEAVDAASRLATETSATELEIARLKFWRLYWGPLSIVENREVEGAMVALGKIVPPQPISSPKLPMVSLQNPSYELAHAARDLMSKSWDVDLPPLKGGQRQ
jgi:hypothetical protein